MKKIVALALCLIMALSLATVAFAADDTYVLYAATSTNLKDGAIKSTVATSADAVTLTEVAAKKNSDGSGEVAYLQFGNNKYVKTTTPTVADFAVAEAGKTTVLYYVTAIADSVYAATAKEFTNFGTKTGQVYSPVAGATYYVDGDDVVYIADDDGTTNLLVGGKVVKANIVGENATLTAGCVVAANYVVTATKASATAGYLVPTEVTDINSDTRYTAIYKQTAAPAGSKVLVTITGEIYDATYVLVAAAGTTAAEGVTSAKTFDAGVALYAGMALMSVAGSAVVIGKKKEF